jgi:hypothetical protein
MCNSVGYQSKVTKGKGVDADPEFGFAGHGCPVRKHPGKGAKLKERHRPGHFGRHCGELVKYRVNESILANYCVIRIPYQKEAS